MNNAETLTKRAQTTERCQAKKKKKKKKKPQKTEKVGNPTNTR